MKYYLVPIEELRTFDENVNNFLKIRSEEHTSELQSL